MSNAHEYTVSELAFALKRTVEDTYGRVRVRGELGRVTIAKSGHCYLDIKDDKAVINSIMWKGVVSRLPLVPEEGIEVIAEGKMSTYPGRSNYQLIIDHMEPAGVGALMALLEKRKKQFAAEGLFDDSRKVELPYLPQTIGVVTSPTGSVIRDILHRIEDRFPRHILLWPALVQGERAAEQISAAIRGFTAMASDGVVPRPDVLIIARGGGSLEDLWCFNEESVVRAAAECNIPLISAVGHETDWTLIDYVADYRAPTPTGAAEVAVPVRADLKASIDDLSLRAQRGLARTRKQKDMALRAARLPRLAAVLSAPRQRLDLATARLPRKDRFLRGPAQRLGLTISKMPELKHVLQPSAQKLSLVSSRLKPAITSNQKQHISRLSALRLPHHGLKQQLARSEHNLRSATQAHIKSMKQKLTDLARRLDTASHLLTAFSYQGVLERGYALVCDEAGNIIRDGNNLSKGQSVELHFRDNIRQKATIIDAAEPIQKMGQANKKKSAGKKASAEKASVKKNDQKQMGLF